MPSTPRSITCLLMRDRLSINYEVSNNFLDRRYTHKYSNNIRITLIQDPVLASYFPLSLWVIGKSPFDYKSAVETGFYIIMKFLTFWTENTHINTQTI